MKLSELENAIKLKEKIKTEKQNINLLENVGELRIVSNSYSQTIPAINNLNKRLIKSLIYMHKQRILKYRADLRDLGINPDL